MTGYTFEQALREHDERKQAIADSIETRVLPDEQAGLWTVGTTVSADEVREFSHWQAEALLRDIPSALAAGVHPSAVVAGYIADAMVLGERLGRNRALEEAA